MKEKRGFTLIELLAVIVILAIIALIATPIVLSLISRARKGAAEDSGYGLRKAAQLYYTSSLLNATSFEEITFKCNGTSCKEKDATTGEQKTGDDAKVLSLDGTIPDNGDITIKSTGEIEARSIKIGGFDCVIPAQGKVICGEDEDEVVEPEPNTGISGSEASGTTPSGNEQGGTDPNDVIIGDGTDPYGYSTASYGYDPNDLTTISTTRPSDRKAYLRYPLTNGKIAAGTMPDTCLNIEKYGGELCLKYNDYEGPEGTRQKVLDYFKWDENTSTSQYSDVTCTINAKYVRCNDKHVQEGRAETRTNTEIRAIDYAGGVSHGCGISSYGIVTCSYD